jgi:hypothetical protein
MSKKYQAIKIVLESIDKRLVVLSSVDIWKSATGIVQDWFAANRRIGPVTFEVHYESGEVFVGHMDLSHGEIDIAKRMRDFCEFYALRRIPPLIENKDRFKRHVKMAYRRQHKAAIRWLDCYEIGTQHE